MTHNSNRTSELDFIRVPLSRTLDYGRSLVKDIDPDRFTEQPHPTMNHPAFCIGHLSLYPARAAAVVGMPDRITNPDSFEPLFKAGVACEPDRGQYPAKGELVDHYVASHETMLSLLDDVPLSALGEPNPLGGRLAEMFPTVGIALNFLLNNHHMVHLGQISAWRRAAGLPAA